MRNCIVSNIVMPILGEDLKLFRPIVATVTQDMAASNLRTHNYCMMVEKIQGHARFGWLRLGIPCDIHRVQTVQTSQYDLAKTHISTMVDFTLCGNGSGEFKKIKTPDTACKICPGP